MRLALLAFSALLLPLALTGCGDAPLPPPLEVYEGGRAVVLSRADSGRALLLKHEPFDSTMTQPMVMRLRLAHPQAAQQIQAGDKIQFDLVMDKDYRIDRVQKLPASTQLRLETAGSSATDTTATDTTATDSTANPSGGA